MLFVGQLLHKCKACSHSSEVKHGRHSLYMEDILFFVPDATTCLVHFDTHCSQRIEHVDRFPGTTMKDVSAEGVS